MFLKVATYHQPRRSMELPQGWNIGNRSTFSFKLVSILLKIVKFHLSLNEIR